MTRIPPLTMVLRLFACLAIVLATLAGCCCPLQRRGTCQQVGPYNGSDQCATCGTGQGHHPLLAHHGQQRPQRAEFVSPLPKFHPVPTRPVFESQVTESGPTPAPFPLGELQPLPTSP